MPAVEKAFGGKKKIAWFEVFAGQAAKDKFDNWLPEDTVEAFREYLVGIKGPLTTPVGGGIVRSMSPCDNCSISLSVSARCNGSRASPRRCVIRRRSTW